MKKYLLVATITLCAVFNGKNAFSQGMGGPSCPHKDLTKIYTEFTDSIARFFTNLKNTTSNDEYANFTGALATDSIEAFDVFGSRSTGLKDSMNALIDSLNSNLALLRIAIDPYSLMSVGAFFDTLATRISCFLADTTINTLEYLVEQCYGTGESTNRLAGDPGPCEDTFRSDMASARYTHNLAVIGCLSVGGACTGWWRLACIGACLLAGEIIYNDAKGDIFCNYLSCRYGPGYCPF